MAPAADRQLQPERPKWYKHRLHGGLDEIRSNQSHLMKTLRWTSHMWTKLEEQSFLLGELKLENGQRIFSAVQNTLCFLAPRSLFLDVYPGFILLVDVLHVV